MKFTIIKEKRVAKKLTQEELAEQAGISRATLSRLETGKLEVCSVGTLKQIAEVLNIKSVNDLIDKET